MSRIKQQIKNNEQKRERIIKKLLDLWPIIPGAYKEVYRKCGKVNCQCVHAKGHPLKRITWTEKGLSRSKAISSEDVQWILKATANYKEFRKLEKKLIDIEKVIHEILASYKQQKINTCRKQKKLI